MAPLQGAYGAWAYPGVFATLDAPATLCDPSGVGLLLDGRW